MPIGRLSHAGKVEGFKPDQEPTHMGPPGYWASAMAWQNMHSRCEHCRKNKPDGNKGNGHRKEEQYRRRPEMRWEREVYRVT